jgi:hypothetical protein
LCPSSRHEAHRQAEAAPGLALCWGCRDDIVRYAQAALDVRRALLDRQAWGAGTSYEPRVAGSTERQIPIEQGASERRVEIGHVLASWARLVLDERGFVALPAVDIASYREHGRTSIAARIIIVSATWLAARPEGGLCRDELRGLVHRAPRAVQWTEVGVCPECKGPCFARLVDGAPRVQCTLVDAHAWAAHEWVGSWMSRASRTLTTAETAALLGLSVDSVRQLVAAGRLTRLGTVRRAAYDRSEVERLHAELWEVATA